MSTVFFFETIIMSTVYQVVFKRNVRSKQTASPNMQTAPCIHAAAAAELNSPNSVPTNISAGSLSGVVTGE